MGLNTIYYFLFTMCLVTYLHAAPVSNDVTLLRSENIHMKENYKFAYETSDGQFREEMGILMNPGTPEEELVVVGRYSYTAPDENVYTVMYTADKNGYRPKTMFKSSKMNRSSMLSKSALKSLVG